jgi:hypothetical protein
VHHAPDSRPPRGEMLAPYRLLAARVIALAIRDLTTHRHTDSEHDSALAFLSGSGMLTHWCEVAGIDPAIVRAQVSGPRTRSGGPGTARQVPPVRP